MDSMVVGCLENYFDFSVIDWCGGVSSFSLSLRLLADSVLLSLPGDTQNVCVHLAVKINTVEP